jgi:hypothetical protein
VSGGQEEGESDQDPQLVLRMQGPGRATPVALVSLEVAGNSQIVTAILRPDEPVSTISSRWAVALGLSSGGAAIAQLVAREEERWGPAERITPMVEEALDERIDEEGLGGFLLGHDFLQSVWLTYLGPAGLVVITDPTT